MNPAGVAEWVNHCPAFLRIIRRHPAAVCAEITATQNRKPIVMARRLSWASPVFGTRAF